MREILFRGKTSRGLWVFGYLQPSIYKDAMLIQDVEANLRVIIPETVGQFTGLVDKNGKKIFEGDIFKYADRTVYTVYWSENRLGFYAFENETNRKDMDGNYLGNFYGSRCEIIGNIFDNSTPTFAF